MKERPRDRDTGAGQAPFPARRQAGDGPAGGSEPGPAWEPEPYKIELPIFEGPLDLLLHLCQKHELNILDIPIAFVTEKYLEYLGLMQALNLDVASEYLLMAATLAHIKSRMLVPPDPSQTEDELTEEGGDPREELIRRLLEYQRYKEAAALLTGGLMVGRDTFLRGAPVTETGGEAPLQEMEIFSLLSAFQRILERVRADVSHDVTIDRISVTERIGELAEILRVRGHVMFEELFDGQTTRIEMVTTLLAILEMTRLKLTRVYQAEPHGAIHITLAVAPEEDTGSAAGPDDLVPNDGNGNGNGNG